MVIGALGGVTVALMLVLLPLGIGEMVPGVERPHAVTLAYRAWVVFTALSVAVFAAPVVGGWL